MPTGLDSRIGHKSYKARAPFHNLEWSSESGDWRITSEKLVFTNRYFIYHKGEPKGHVYDCLGEALDYVLAHATAEPM